MARKKPTGKSKVRGHTARVVVVDEAQTMHEHVTLKEAQGGGANAVERQGLDLHRYTMDHVLPEAVAACDAGIEREKALERDVQQHQGRVVILCQEVRGMTAKQGGIIREQRGWWRTMTPLPGGIKAVMGKSEAEIRWAYAQACRAQRLAKTHREALNMAGPNAISFVLVSGGIELAGI